jgi:hypothetical protein
MIDPKTSNNRAKAGSVKHNQTEDEDKDLSKLSQQNISQPRRREPTSRVAPKNQVTQPQLDNSILSTNISISQPPKKLDRPSSTRSQQSQQA